MANEKMPEQNAIPPVAASGIAPSRSVWSTPDNYENLNVDELMRAAQREMLGDNLPPKTAETEDFCRVVLNVVNVYGPKDLGSGPVYAVETTDADNFVNTFYIGWTTAVPQLDSPGYREWVRRGYPSTIEWDRVQGAKQSYYVCRILLQRPENA